MNFITNSHVGFICVYFADTHEFVRWGVLKAWKAPGRRTLSKVEKRLRRSIGPAADFDLEAVIVQHLADMLALAAADRDLGKLQAPAMLRGWRPQANT